MIRKDFEYNRYGNSTYFSAKGDMNVEENWYPCFGEFTKQCFEFSEHDQEFCITLYKVSSDTFKHKYYNNACIFNKTEIAAHLEEIQEVCNFSYKILQYRDRYVLKIKVKAYSIYIKFILTWVRLLYKWPYNVLYRDALRVHKLKEFSNLNLISVFNLVCSTNSKAQFISCEESFIYPQRFTEPLTYKEIKEKIEELIKTKIYWLNFIFPITDNEGLYILPDEDYYSYSIELSSIIYGNIDKKSITDPELEKFYGLGDSVFVYEFPSKEVFKRIPSVRDYVIYGQNKYWANDVNFAKRLKLYKENLNILNNYLKNKQ